ncbi:MAG: hypothetical protein ACTHM1_00530 [Solirubrobacteraceae bacterium]
MLRGGAGELAARFAEQPARGEVVIVVEQARARAWQLDQAVHALEQLVQAGARTRPAAGVVAALTGVPANELYRSLTGAHE